MTRFKQENLGYLPGESGGYYDNLRQMKERLAGAELELKVEQDRVEVLRKQLSGETPSFGIAPTPMEVTANTQEIDRRIELNQVRLDELLLRYTDKHPDVVSLRRSISDLKADRKTLLSRAQQGATDPQSPGYDVNVNPVYQQMRIALSHAEAEIGAKQAVVTEYRERIKGLEGAVDRVLRVEAEQAQLNRDYQVLKKNYDELVARLESARLARKADTRSESVRFRVIDPPRVPAKPSAPNRLLLSSGVLLAALLLGTAVAFLFGQLRPTFAERKLLNEMTGLPVLGSIDMVWTPSQRRARQMRNLSFLVSIFGLVAVYGLVMAVYLVGGDVLTRITSGMGLS